MANTSGSGGGYYGKAGRERRAKKRREQQKRTGYVRPSRAKARAGWSLHELAQMTGMRETVLKRWFETEVVPRPPFRGVATRYERQQLVWVLAVRRMQAKEQVPLPKIKERLTAMSGEQVEALAREACPPGAAAALGIATATSAVAGAPNASWLEAPGGPLGKPADGTGAGMPFGGIQAPAGSASAAATALPAGGSGIGRWTRFDLGLGLELSVRDDASRVVRALAVRIRELCAADAMRTTSDEPLW